MKMNSTRWAAVVVAALGVVSYAIASVPTPEGPSLKIDAECVGGRRVISLHGYRLPNNRTIGLYFMDMDNGLFTVGKLDLVTDQKGNFREDILPGGIGTRLRVDVVGTDPVDDVLALMLGGDLGRMIASGHTITSGEVKISGRTCRETRL